METDAPTPLVIAIALTPPESEADPIVTDIKASVTGLKTQMLMEVLLHLAEHKCGKLVIKEGPASSSVIALPGRVEPAPSTGFA